jgi:hypothetical protein
VFERLAIEALPYELFRCQAFLDDIAICQDSKRPNRISRNVELSPQARNSDEFAGLETGPNSGFLAPAESARNFYRVRLGRFSL